MKHIEVSAAILIHDNKVLAAKRGAGIYEYLAYKYEFPGGKLEFGESPKEALRRELNEEMDIVIQIENMKYFYTVNYKYPDFLITMHSFICPLESCNVNLKAHDSIKWMYLKDLDKLDWAPADIPLVNRLIERGF